MKNNDPNFNQKRVLLFIVVNAVKKKTLQEILDTKFEYFEDNYLDQFFS